MSAPAYDAYRDSGIDWLGKVPRHWDTVRLRRLVEIKKRIAGKEGPDVLSITQRGIKVRDTTSNDGQLASSYAHYQLVEPGDFAMNHMDLLTGWVDISPFHGVTSPDYRVFSARSGANVDPRYLLWVLQQGYIGRTFFALGQGSSHLGRWRLPADAFNEFEVALPPQGEQRAIAAFLDRETGKIDALVEAQARLIELLKEKRQTVISHAVTKGLDPAAPMKDSGMEWLGQVPAHWEVKKLGSICSKIGSGKTPSGGAEAYVEAGIAFLRSQNVYDEGLWLDELVYIPEAVDEEMSNTRVQPGDVLLNITGASLGRTCIVPEPFERANVNQHVCIIRLQDVAQRDYVSMAMKSISTKGQIDATQNGAAREGLNFQQIATLHLALPPENEASEIVKAVCAQIDGLDRLTKHAEAAITLLQERRATLISAAITGKIDVRDLASEQAEAA